MRYFSAVRIKLARVLVVTIVCACAAAVWPVYADAGSGGGAPAAATLIITELQTGSAGSANEEFIELYNPTGAAVDVTGWQIEFVGASADGWEAPQRTIALSGSVDKGAYMVVASSYNAGGVVRQYLAGQASVFFSAGIAAAGGHVRLTYPVHLLDGKGVCAPAAAIADQMEWGDTSLDERTVFAPADTPPLPGQSMQRQATVGGRYADSDNDQADFAFGTPTPGAPNAAGVLAAESAAAGAAIVSDCEPAPSLPPDDSGQSPAEEPAVPEEPVLPPADAGLLAPQISELLPNPAAPLTDAADEFVELYNPNDAVFDLAGFSLKSGLKGAYAYSFPEGTRLPPRGFASFPSKDTGLVLSNTAGKVVLLDPFGTVIAETEAYGKALPGQSWVFAEGAWSWTSAPTSDAPNQLVVPPVKAAPAGTAKPVARKPAARITAVKGAATPKKTKVSAPKPVKAVMPEPAKTGTASIRPAPPSSPLHPALLAGAAVLALLYGAYEYRHDMANKIRQLRSNRSLRRTPGKGA